MRENKNEELCGLTLKEFHEEMAFQRKRYNSACRRAQDTKDALQKIVGAAQKLINFLNIMDDSTATGVRVRAEELERLIAELRANP